MSNPRPKTKLDEVAEFIYNNSDELYLTEFQVARFERMINEAESIDFIRAKRQRALIYYQSGNYKKAKSEINSLTNYLEDGSLYSYLIGIAIRIGSISEAIKISEKFNLSIYKTLPKHLIETTLDGLVTLIFLKGNSHKQRDFLMNLAGEIKSIGFDEHADFIKYKVTNLFETFEFIEKKCLDLTSFFNVIEKCSMENKIRILGIKLLVVDDEFLMDLGVNVESKKAIEFNDKLFDLAFKNNLLAELSVFSMNYTPVDMEHLKNAIN